MHTYVYMYMHGVYNVWVCVCVHTCVCIFIYIRMFMYALLYELVQGLRGSTWSILPGCLAKIGEGCNVNLWVRIYNVRKGLRGQGGLFFFFVCEFVGSEHDFLNTGFRVRTTSKPDL